MPTAWPAWSAWKWACRCGRRCFPLTQTARKVAPALAAGCTIVIKPASYTPAATYELVKLIQETSIPRGVLNLVPGRGNVVGEEIIASKKVDKISFTGETGTGKRIGAQAGMEVKRVTRRSSSLRPSMSFLSCASLGGVKSKCGVAEELRRFTSATS
jgi:betaine-aldehyde dehydrogenase